MKLKKTLLASGAAVALLMGSQAAFATTTVTVNGSKTPPADVAVSAPATSAGIVFGTDFGVPASCSGGTASGYVKRGASATGGTKIGAIQSLTFASGCVATSLNFPVAITKKGTTSLADEWGIYADGTPAKGATTINVEIRNVDAQMIDSARPVGQYRCAVNAGLKTGVVKAQIRLNVNGTTADQLVVNTPSLGTDALRFPLPLDALDASANKAGTATSSCGGEIVDGDRASMVGTFTLNQQVSIS